MAVRFQMIQHLVHQVGVLTVVPIATDVHHRPTSTKGFACAYTSRALAATGHGERSAANGQAGVETAHCW